MDKQDVWAVVDMNGRPSTVRIFVPLNTGVVFDVITEVASLVQRRVVDLICHVEDEECDNATSLNDVDLKRLEVRVVREHNIPVYTTPSRPGCNLSAIMTAANKHGIEIRNELDNSCDPIHDASYTKGVATFNEDRKEFNRLHTAQLFHAEAEGVDDTLATYRSKRHPLDLGKKWLNLKAKDIARAVNNIQACQYSQTLKSRFPLPKISRPRKSRIITFSVSLLCADIVKLDNEDDGTMHTINPDGVITRLRQYHTTNRSRFKQKLNARRHTEQYASCSPPVVKSLVF